MRRSLRLAALLCLLIGTAGAAHATSTVGETKTFLQLLESGESLVSGNGQLVFENFQLSTLRNLPEDLSLYTVSALEDGIRIQGPLTAGVGGARLSLLYTVSGLGEAQIEDAHLGVFASGSGGVVDVDESLFVHQGGCGGMLDWTECGPEILLPVADLDVLILEVPGRATDEAWFEPLRKLWVRKDIVLEGGPETQVTVEYVDQRFSLVPEPAGWGLLGFALLGLWRQGGRRRR
jgi:hypothetical protein